MKAYKIQNIEGKPIKIEESFNKFYTSFSKDSIIIISNNERKIKLMRSKAPYSYKFDVIESFEDYCWEDILDFKLEYSVYRYGDIKRAYQAICEFWPMTVRDTLLSFAAEIEYGGLIDKLELIVNKARQYTNATESEWSFSLTRFLKEFNNIDYFIDRNKYLSEKNKSTNKKYTDDKWHSI